MTTVKEPVAGAVDMVEVHAMFPRSPGTAVVARPALWERLEGAPRVTVVSSPAGTGKTVLLRSWIGATGLAGRAAWVTVPRDERDPRRFWVSVAGALRHTAAGPGLVRELTAAPDLDGWAIVERLAKDLARLRDPVWLVIDDVHELGSSEALAQLELLVLRAPETVRIVLATRRDLRLRLHRLRLEGELAEIRAADLRFTVQEARDMFRAVGVQVPEQALLRLHERTEGWAAGLRLAALSLDGHPDPERFAAEFSGSERTVAEYLLTEVLDHQSEPVRQLLLRTSVCERINGELADLLTSGRGGERILQDLEEAGAFVEALDGQRSWFRYHRLFADLLQLELRCVEPAELDALHGAAGGWFAAHGYPLEAIRHAQAAHDWSLATRVLLDHFLGLVLDGQGATAHELLARFPADMLAADPELAVLMAADDLFRRSPDAAEHHLARADQGATAVPAGRRGRFQVNLAVMRLMLSQSRGDLPAVIREARLLLTPGDCPGNALPGLRQDLRALALVSLGTAELWAVRASDAEQQLEQGACRMRLEEAKVLLERAERALRGEADAERVAGLLIAAHPRSTPHRAHMLQTLIRLGETGRVEQALAGLEQAGSAEMRNALATLRLAQGDPQAATLALAPVLAGSAPVTDPGWLAQAFLLEAIARDALADLAASGRALERALDLAEADGAVSAFLLHPAPELLRSHATRGTAHAALIAQILGLMAGSTRPVPRCEPDRLREPLSGCEARVLRLLQTNLSGPEIARQLSVSVNTVRTHIKHLYEKLGVHTRTEAVERARTLGLFAPS